MDQNFHRSLGWLRRPVLIVLGFCLMFLGGVPVSRDSARPVTIAFLGDIMLGRGIRPSAGSFEYLEPYLRSADLTLANLESPLTDAPADDRVSYNLCAKPQAAKVLSKAGFDLLVLANNHSRDCGEAGLRETKAVLQQAGMGFIGPDPIPVYREVRGVRLAFLAFNVTGDFDLDSARQAVRDAHNTGAAVIVSMHWGAEYQYGPSSGQEEIAFEMVQAGAALIWGHHPHILQPALRFHSVPVIFSLGNAIFDQNGLDSVRQSALLLFTVDAHGAKIRDAIPFVIDVRNSRIVEAGRGETSEILKALGPDIAERDSH